MHQQRASQWKAAEELDPPYRGTQAGGKNTQRKNDIHQLPFNAVASQRTSGAGKTSGIQCGGQPAQPFDELSARIFFRGRLGTGDLMSSQLGFFIPQLPGNPGCGRNPGRSGFCVETAAVDDK